MQRCMNLISAYQPFHKPTIGCIPFHPQFVTFHSEFFPKTYKESPRDLAWTTVQTTESSCWETKSLLSFQWCSSQRETVWFSQRALCSLSCLPKKRSEIIFRINSVVWLGVTWKRVFEQVLIYVKICLLIHHRYVISKLQCQHPSEREEQVR